MSYTLLRGTRPAARKVHRCIWCGQPIPAGEVHYQEASIYDGEFQNHRWHTECDIAFSEQMHATHEEEFEPYGNERPVRSQDSIAGDASPNTSIAEQK